ncbi:MAG: ABC transporter substrate-binding protein [Deltaproteobacteria bacterium]|nr:ABC transporter substrate-binding protein [Deltaproteobacteria bacterium]
MRLFFRRSSPKRTLILLGAVLLALSLEGGTSRGLAATKVSLAVDFVILGRHAPFFVALEKGFWAERGLEVSINRGFGGFDTARRVGQKQTDFGFTDMAAAALLRSQGMRVVQVAVIYHNWPHTVFARPEIKTLKELEGRTFGTPPGSTGMQLVSAFAEVAGIDWSKVKVVNLDIATQNAALISGKVDAISTFRFFIPFFRSKIPNVSMFPWSDYGWKMYSNGIVVHEDTLAQKSDVVRSFVEGALLGYKYAIEHPDEAVDTLLKHRPEIARDGAKAEQPFIKELVMAPEVAEHGLGAFDPAKVRFSFDILYRYLDLPRTITPKEVYSDRWLSPVKP